ncbi:hypothetical protein [Ancylobacter sp. G4_0304]|uniref:hypothetical protein n=1 Tax=Ancylobacter sp. G4_0304 TaxID=3114289 RepID=UPI0039C701E2
MSANGGSTAWEAGRRAVVSVLLIAVAGWVGFKGAQFAWVGMETRSAFPRLLADYPTLPEQSEVVAVRDQLSPWRQTWGLRDTARISYFDVGRSLLKPLPATVLNEAAEVLAVNPLRGVTWVDFAVFSLLQPGTRSLALDAWELSGIAVPYDVGAIAARTRFLMSYWPRARDSDKQRFFREASLLLSVPGGTTQWRTMILALPPEQKAQVEQEFKAVSPRYRPVR